MRFYRYEEILYYGDGCKLIIRTFDLIEETPCGYWIGKNIDDEFLLYHEKKRWVSKTSRKRFAYPTKKEALDNFIARKHRQIAILKARIREAKMALTVANDVKEE